MEEKEKRRVSAFIPYRRGANGFEFYMQKRSIDAPTTAGLFNFFGGGIEGEETPDQGALREIQEELMYIPKRLVLFSKYETARRLSYVYVEEVGHDFESHVNVQEGDYGKFRLRNEIEFDPGTSLFAQIVIRELCNYFLKE